MAVQKTTTVNYNKVIGGQTNSFGYNFGESAPERISVNLPINIVTIDDKKEVCNGNLSISINVANREIAKEDIQAAVRAAFDEIENIVVNYENPEAV